MSALIKCFNGKSTSTSSSFTHNATWVSEWLHWSQLTRLHAAPSGATKRFILFFIFYMMKTYVGHNKLAILNTNTQDGMSREDSKDHRYVITIKTQLHFLSAVFTIRPLSKKITKKEPWYLKAEMTVMVSNLKRVLMKKFWQTKSSSSDQHQSADRHRQRLTDEYSGELSSLKRNFKLSKRLLNMGQS